MENAHLLDLHWMDNYLVQLKTLGERYPLQGASAEWRVVRVWHDGLLFILGDTRNHSNVSGQIV